MNYEQIDPALATGKRRRRNPRAGLLVKTAGLNMSPGGFESQEMRKLGKVKAYLEREAYFRSQRLF